MPLEDLLQIVVLERQLLAIDATGTGQADIELEIGERVRWHDARGRIGVALTDQRVLAIATGAGWVQQRYRPTESPATGALLGDRVALVETSERMIGFTAAGGTLIEYRLGPRERVLARRAGANVAAFATGRRALGLSAQLGGFYPTDVGLRERVVALTASANVATLRTDRRLLVFQGPTGFWEERRLELGNRPR